MPNLLPKKEKEILYREYREKLIVVSIGAFVALIVAATALLLPAYILSVSKLSSSEEDLRILRESVSYKQGRNTEEKLKRTESELQSLGSVIKNGELQEIFFQVVDDTPAGISLTAITFRELGQSGAEISLVGTAADRIGLIGYANALKTNPNFKKVDLPISNLAREDDITFDIRISIQ